MRIYFDACCVNRLTDNQVQERVAREAEAIEKLIGFATTEPNRWISSVVLETEIERNRDVDRQADAQFLLAFATEVVKLDNVIVDRARRLEEIGVDKFDALHLACAEGRADVFLTTDDKLLRKANKQGNPLIRVLNPVSFLEELNHADNRND